MAPFTFYSVFLALLKWPLLSGRAKIAFVIIQFFPSNWRYSVWTISPPFISFLIISVDMRTLQCSLCWVGSIAVISVDVPNWLVGVPSNQSPSLLTPVLLYPRHSPQGASTPVLELPQSDSFVWYYQWLCIAGIHLKYLFWTNRRKSCSFFSAGFNSDEVFSWILLVPDSRHCFR